MISYKLLLSKRGVESANFTIKLNITALQFTHYIRLKKQSCLNEELAECAGNCIKNHNSYHKSYNKEIFERKRK